MKVSSKRFTFQASMNFFITTGSCGISSWFCDRIPFIASSEFFVKIVVHSYVDLMLLLMSTKSSIDVRKHLSPCSKLLLHQRLICFPHLSCILIITGDACIEVVDDSLCAPTLIGFGRLFGCLFCIYVKWSVINSAKSILGLLFQFPFILTSPSCSRFSVCRIFPRVYHT